jgi:hypothetical protein
MTVPDTMNTALELALDELVAALAEVEREMQTATLSHSDQQVLDQAWEYYTEQIELVEEMLLNAYNDTEDTRVGCECCAGCAYCDEAIGYDPSGEI